MTSTFDMSSPFTPSKKRGMDDMVDGGDSTPSFKRRWTDATLPSSDANGMAMHAQQAMEQQYQQQHNAFTNGFHDKNATMVNGINESMIMGENDGRHSIRHHLSIPSFPSNIGFNHFASNGSNISSPAISAFSTTDGASSAAASVYDFNGEPHHSVFGHDSPDMMGDEDVSFNDEAFARAQAHHQQQQMLQQQQQQQQQQQNGMMTDGFAVPHQQTPIEIQAFRQHPLAGFYDSYNGGNNSFYANEEDYMDEEEDRMARRYIGNGAWDHS